MENSEKFGDSVVESIVILLVNPAIASPCYLESALPELCAMMLS